MAAGLKKQIQEILDRSKSHGWVMEPDAKQILALANIAVLMVEALRRWQPA